MGGVAGVGRVTTNGLGVPELAPSANCCGMRCMSTNIVNEMVTMSWHGSLDGRNALATVIAERNVTNVTRHQVTLGIAILICALGVDLVTSSALNMPPCVAVEGRVRGVTLSDRNTH